jgi:AraC-like DNA-binding protein
MTQAIDQNEPRTILSVANAIARALEAQGVDSKELFKQADIPYQATSDNSYYISSRKISTLFKLAVEATGDPSFGLKIVYYVHPTTFHALGYSLYASDTLFEFCQRLERFFRLLSDEAKHHLSEEEDGYRLGMEILNPEVCLESIDGWLGCIVHFCRNIYRPDFSPQRIEMTRPSPKSDIAAFEKFYQCPIIFGADENAIFFSKEDIHMQLPSANAELARINDEVVLEHLARFDKHDITRQVEAKVIKLLPTGECSKEKIASLLNVGPRSLQNKLEQQGTSYQEILERLRSSLACQYIKQQEKSICEITYLLGFSDTSNFSRAFRRWTGVSPTKYRDQHSNAGPK